MSRWEAGQYGPQFRGYVGCGIFSVGCFLAYMRKNYQPLVDRSSGREKTAGGFDLHLQQVKIASPGLCHGGCGLVSGLPWGLIDAPCHCPVKKIRILPGQRTPALMSQWMDFLWSGTHVLGCHNLGSWENKKTALCRGSGENGMRGSDQVELSLEMLHWGPWIPEGPEDKC